MAQRKSRWVHLITHCGRPDASSCLLPTWWRLCGRAPASCHQLICTHILTHASNTTLSPDMHTHTHTHTVNGSLQPPVQALHLLLGSIAVAASLTAAAGGITTLPALHRGAPWWTVLFDAWCMPRWNDVARVLFFAYIFGRPLDNSQGGAALWLTWLLGSAGGARRCLCSSRSRQKRN